MRCQCNAPSVDHAKNECQHKATYYVRRDGKHLAVCDDCRISKDFVLRDVEPDE